MAKKELDCIYWLPSNRISHFYFIQNKRGEFDLVDTSAPIERWKINFFLKRRKAKLDRLLLTHSHADHAGSADYLARKQGCAVLAHPKELPFLKGEAQMDKRDYTGINFFGRVVQFGDWLFGQPIHKEALAYHEHEGVEEEYEFVPLHGHTKGSTGIVHKATKSIFLGDALINCSAIEMFPRPGLMLPYGYFTEDPKQAKESLNNLRDVDFENAFFGHGDPIIGGAKKKVLNFLASVESN